MKSVKLDLLRYAVNGLLSLTLLTAYITCAAGGYQPPIPEQLKECE